MYLSIHFKVDQPNLAFVCFPRSFPKQSYVERHLLYAPPLSFRWTDPSRAAKTNQEKAAAEGKRVDGGAAKGF